MKKSLKLALAIMSIILLAFAITGCGNNKKNAESTNNVSNVNEENGKSKTYNVLSKAFSGENYVITLQCKADVGEGEEEAIMTIAKKGENMYMDVETVSQHATVMYKDGNTYFISHDDKACGIMEGKDEGTFNKDMTLISKEDLKDIEAQEYKKGKEIIDETEYDYEEFVADEGSTTKRYYFSKNDLRYIKLINEDEEELMKVLKISSEVDDNLFDIPADYETVDMDNL